MLQLTSCIFISHNLTFIHYPLVIFNWFSEAYFKLKGGRVLRVVPNYPGLDPSLLSCVAINKSCNCLTLRLYNLIFLGRDTGRWSQPGVSLDHLIAGHLAWVDTRGLQFLNWCTLTININNVRRRFLLAPSPCWKQLSWKEVAFMHYLLWTGV